MYKEAYDNGWGRRGIQGPHRLASCSLWLTRLGQSMKISIPIHPIHQIIQYIQYQWLIIQYLTRDIWNQIIYIQYQWLIKQIKKKSSLTCNMVKDVCLCSHASRCGCVLGAECWHRLCTRRHASHTAVVRSEPEESALRRLSKDWKRIKQNVI